VILEELKKWEDKLLGRLFKILTNHKALQFFKLRVKCQTARYSGVNICISQFQVNIIYIEGKLNKVANSLSKYCTKQDEQAPFPMDVLVNMDQILDPEGEDLPVACFISKEGDEV
jgi:hypothetical protein